MSPSNLPIMRISLVLRASALALGLVGWMAAPALASPMVLSMTPAEGAEMHEPPGDVTIEFSEPLQASSNMKVVDECGTTVSDGDARVIGTAMNELNVVIGDAPHAGTYTVRYVATGVTGTTTDSYEFLVHGGTNCDGSGGGHHHSGGGMDMGGHGGHSGSHEGHGGMDMSGHGNHNGSGDHSHMDMSGGHMDHQNMGHMNMGKNKGSHHNMKGMKGMKGMHHGNQNNNSNAPRAAGGPLISGDIPTGSTVVIALGLAILMGLLGGWVLRVSSPS